MALAVVPISAAELLQEVSELAPPLRKPLLAKYVRSGRIDAQTLAALAAPSESLFSAGVAVTVADIRKDEAMLAQLVNDARVEVAQRAAQPAAEHVRDAKALMQPVFAQPPVVRRAVLRALSRCGRTEIADALMPELAKHCGCIDLIQLLPACSEPLVREHLPDVVHAIRSWTRLVRFHPHVVLEWLSSDLQRRPSWAAWEALAPLRSAFAALAVRHAPELLELLLRVLPQGGIPPSIVPLLPTLMRRQPTRVFELLLRPRSVLQLLQSAPQYRGSLDPLRELVTAKHHGRIALRALGTEQLQQLARRLVLQPDRLALLLSGVPPRQRAALLQAARAPPVETAALGASDVVLRQLPCGPVREAEAQRLLSLHAVRNDTAQERLVRSFLPYAQVEGSLRELTRAATPEDRGLGYRLLLACAARDADPGALIAALAYASQRVVRDQDAVKAELLSAVLAIPAQRLRAEHEPHLRALLEAVRTGRDSAQGTARTLLPQLAARLCREACRATCARVPATELSAHLPLEPAGRTAARDGAVDWRWPLSWALFDTALQMGVGPTAPLEGVPRAARRLVASRYLRTYGDMLTEENQRAKRSGVARRGRADAAGAADAADAGGDTGGPDDAVVHARSLGFLRLIAESLDRDGRDWAPLQQALEAAVMPASRPLHAALVSLWLADPHQRSARVAALFAVPKRQTAVLMNLDRIRTTVLQWHYPLLRRVLEAGPHAVSAFSSMPGGVVRRLSPPMAALYRDKWLAVLVRGDGPGLYNEAPYALRSLSYVPGVTVETVQAMLAAMPEADRQTVLQNLPDIYARLSDRRAVLPLLLTQLADPEISFAAATSLYTALMRVPAAEAQGVLTDLLQSATERKLTVAAQKALMRMGAALFLPRFADVMLGQWMRPAPPLHRDVRIAMVGACFTLLSWSAAWNILTLATEAEPEVARAALRSPAAVPIRYRSRFLQEIIQRVLPNRDVECCRAAVWLMKEWVVEAACDSGTPVAAQATAALAALVTDLERGSSVWSGAALTLATCVTVPAAVPPVLRALQQLSTAVPTEAAALQTATTRPERDLPSAQRRAALVHNLTELAPDMRAAAAEGLQALAAYLATLEDDPVAQVQSLQLRVAALSWSDVAGTVTELRSLVTRAERVMPDVCAPQLVRVLEDSLDFKVSGAAQPIRNWEPADAMQVVSALASDASVLSRRLACAVLARVGERLEWNAPCRALLLRFRTDSSAAVRFQAYNVLMSQE